MVAEHGLRAHTCVHVCARVCVRVDPCAANLHHAVSASRLPVRFMAVVMHDRGHQMPSCLCMTDREEGCKMVLELCKAPFASTSPQSLATM